MGDKSHKIKVDFRNTNSSQIVINKIEEKCLHTGYFYEVFYRSTYSIAEIKPELRCNFITRELLSKLKAQINVYLLFYIYNTVVDQIFLKPLPRSNT